MRAKHLGVDDWRPYELLPLAALVIGAALATLGAVFFVFAGISPACAASLPHPLPRSALVEPTGTPSAQAGHRPIEDGAETVRRAAIAEGVPPSLALAVAAQESGLDCNVRDSSAGAVGIMQVLPATAAEFGVSRAELATCEGAARAGVRYLKAALDKTGGDEEGAAHLYFAGLNARPNRKSAYARKVMARKRGAGA